MNTLKVLVVDDEPGIRSGVRRILTGFSVDYPFMDEKISFEVLEAESGEAGLEIIDREPVDVVLLDNKLPGIQGTDMLEIIKQKRPETLVTMITSYASLDVAIKATATGAYDFMPKPFTPQELKSSLENITKHLFLKRLTKKLQKDGKHIRYQFLQVLSHELKGPANAIEGCMNMIIAKRFGNDIDSYLDITRQSLEKLKEMRGYIMDLLDLTRFESGQTQSEAQKIDLKSLIMASIDLHKPYATQKDISINLYADRDVSLTAIPEEIEIAINHLISNALKYNKPGGKVDIILRCEETDIRIMFVDSGIGIPEEEQNNLFREFFRIRNEATKDIKGSGLGLSIVKKIVTLYDGTVDVKSKQGEGSVFTITLPQNCSNSH